MLSFCLDLNYKNIDTIEISAFYSVQNFLLFMHTSHKLPQKVVFSLPRAQIFAWVILNYPLFWTERKVYPVLVSELRGQGKFNGNDSSLMTESSAWGEVVMVLTSIGSRLSTPYGVHTEQDRRGLLAWAGKNHQAGGLCESGDVRVSKPTAWKVNLYKA